MRDVLTYYGWYQLNEKMGVPSGIEDAAIKIFNHPQVARPVRVQGRIRILKVIMDKFSGGPVGLSTIATAIGENAGTLEEVYEPFLIQEGFLMRTPRGRKVTEKTYKHLGRDMGYFQGGLF